MSRSSRQSEPTLPHDPDEEQLALLLADLTDRVQRGEHVDLEQTCRDHPRHAQDLRELWGAVLVAEAAGSVDADVASGALRLASDEPPLGKGPQNAPQEPLHEGFAVASAATGRDGSLEIPCRFGDYELLEEIGRGGMGVVYRARQISLNRQVAVKMILPGRLASEADQLRFRAEAEAAARLHHRGIVPVFEVGEVEGRAYFNMEYIEGATLAERLRNGPLPSREAARLIADVAQAIDYAHQKGVLHRDLKPSNILLDEQGTAHVTDFGLAKQISDPASLTKTGAVLGTPAYMAPEQAAGDRGQVGPASDVYSLGTILYHSITGRPPFQASSPVDTVLLVLEQDPPRPRVINPAIPRDLEMIVLRCLQKPSDLRYPTAQALADDLKAYLHDEPISARSGRLMQIVSRIFRETHHATVLENWGLLWMWHSLAIFIACVLTNTLYFLGVQKQIYYVGLWTAGFWAWAAVFWALRRRMGPVTFVERQIAHLWAASMLAIALLFPVERLLGFDVLKLSPMLGLINGMVFMVKAAILSGEFYIQAAALYLTAIIMACLPQYAHLIFGAVSAACFFFPGMKYYRQRVLSENELP